MLALVELAERPEVDPRAAEALGLPDLVEVEEERLCRRPAVAPLGAREHGPRPLEALPTGPRDTVGEVDQLIRLAPALAESERRELGQAVVVPSVIGTVIAFQWANGQLPRSCSIVPRLRSDPLLSELLELFVERTRATYSGLF